MIDPTQPLVVNEGTEQQENTKRAATPASWKPGQSGNPNGRPKKDWTWADLLAEAAEEMMDLKDKQGNVRGRGMLKKLVAKKMLTKAAGGDTSAARLIMDRMDGMPLQATDITTMGEKLIMPHVTVDTKPEDNNG